MFALVDGNSFYCSCECAFDPTLRNNPIVVLSNNDGCAIARTNEAKDLGIKMGEPYHLAAKRPELKDVIWKSSNYVLYGDMSRRMFDVLAARVPRVEPYSIDEMFLDLAGMPVDLVDLSREIRAAVRKIAKVPTCVGIGRTKVIAKLANKLAKQDRAGPGVVDLRDEEARSLIYPSVDIGDVWGMGRASVAKLERLNVRNVADFVALDPEQIRELLTVTGQRTHAELRGIVCFGFSEGPQTRKSIACTRSFGRPVLTWAEMSEALATYASRAAEKLRRHGLYASAMQVFMRTNEFNNDPKYSNSVTFEIEASADTLTLASAATRAGEKLWRDGYRYFKAGIVLLDLYKREELPTADMFATRDPARSAVLMTALDSINGRFGRETARLATMATKREWSMRRSNLSPSYTTQISDILRVRA